MQAASVDEPKARQPERALQHVHLSRASDSLQPPHQRSQEMVPALITRFLEAGGGRGAVAGSPGGNTQPPPRCHGSESHPATCPAHRCRAPGADPSVPKNGQFFKAFLLAHPLPAACSHAGEGSGTLHTPNTTPARIILQSCLGATSLTERGRESGNPTRMAHPSTGAGEQPGQRGGTPVPQPSPIWQHRLNDKAAEGAD